MPARNKPVINLDSMITGKPFAKKMRRLDKAAAIAQIKKTFEGEKRSAMVKMAKSSVPEINPNCTAETKWPKASGCKKIV